MKRLALVTALAATTLLGAAAARGELVQSGELRLAFDGRFTPHALPRERAAPVTVKLSGSVGTVDGERPPQLRRMSIAVNRYGKISTRGLPVCHRGRLEATSSRAALARCRSALVGRGTFGADVDLPRLVPFPVTGRMLAFNGRARGKPVIFMHIYGEDPVKTTLILTFHISHPKRGTFGTVLTTKIPKIASDLGYVTDISLSFGRRYEVRGQERSFLSARCAAPAGFPGAIFPFTRGSFKFANGQKLTSTVIRDCRVR